MTGYDYPIEHFELMSDIAKSLKDSNAQLLEHEYLYNAFGSWWIMIEWSGKRSRLLFDGREYRLVLERNVGYRNEPPDWEEIAAQEVINNSEPNFPLIARFLNTNLFFPNKHL